jgi:hypothetical protein
MTDAFCGPDIVREDEKRIQALQQDKYGTLVAVVFNKATYTATIASLDWWMPNGGAATIDYLDCFWP